MNQCSKCIHAITTSHFKCGKGYAEKDVSQYKYRRSYHYFYPGSGYKVGYYSDCLTFKSKTNEAQQPISVPQTQSGHTGTKSNVNLSDNFWNLFVDDESAQETVGNYQAKTHQYSAD